jgi:hypothetical protein
MLRPPGTEYCSSPTRARDRRYVAPRLDTLEQRINERRNGGAGRQHDQSTEHNEHDDDRQEPEFLPLFHEAPQFQQKITHMYT